MREDGLVDARLVALSGSCPVCGLELYLPLDRPVRWYALDGEVHDWGRCTLPARTVPEAHAASTRADTADPYIEARTPRAESENEA